MKAKQTHTHKHKHKMIIMIIIRMMMMVKLISDVYGSLRFQFRVIFLFSFFETWNRASSNKTVDVINQPG